MAEQPTKGLVLYVEDEEGDALFMEFAFQKAGLKSALRIVRNGREAIDYISGKGAYIDRGQHPVPGVVLLDLNLPLISGFEVLEWIRSHPDYKSLPVVVFSSSSDEEDQHKTLQLGANEFVEKPRSPMLFGNVVQKLRDKFLAGTA